MEFVFDSNFSKIIVCKLDTTLFVVLPKQAEIQRLCFFVLLFLLALSLVALVEIIVQIIIGNWLLNFLRFCCLSLYQYYEKLPDSIRTNYWINTIKSKFEAVLPLPVTYITLFFTP